MPQRLQHRPRLGRIRPDVAGGEMIGMSSQRHRFNIGLGYSPGSVGIRMVTHKHCRKLVKGWGWLKAELLE